MFQTSSKRLQQGTAFGAGGLLLMLAISVTASFQPPSKENIALGRELFLHE